MTELLRVSTAEATTTRPDGGSGMMDESGQAVGELVQEYVRLKWKRAGPPVRARTIGQHLGPALRSRIDVLGTDGEQLLEVRPSAVMQRIEGEIQQEDILYPGMEQARAVPPAKRAGELGREAHGPL